MMRAHTLMMLDKLSSVRAAPDVCADLHALVRRFRVAQRIAEGDLSHEIGCARYHRIINGYLARLAALDFAEVISRVTPQRYAELRQAGRLRPLYPELPKASLQILADEIRAALVWEALLERGYPAEIAVSDDELGAEARRDSAHESDLEYAVGT